MAALRAEKITNRDDTSKGRLGMDQQYYVYMLANRRKGALYTGMTNDLIKRVYQHKHEHGSSHTRKYSIKTLVWYEIHNDVEEAILREKRIKRYSTALKRTMIEEQNPD